MDEIFKALADPSRRRLLDSLNVRNGQRLNELCAGLDMARQSVSKHLAVLERANLVTTVRHADLKQALETPMGEPAFVYTTFIKTTPEQLWKALTDPAFTRRYWGVSFETDWRPGSTMVWEGDGHRIVDPDQVVLEAEPPRRLAYTWHTPTTEWASANGIDDDVRAALAAESRSRVTFEVEPFGETVKLTVVHDDFPAGSTMRAMVSSGWPYLVSDLKTLMETGATLPPAPAEAGRS